MNLEESILEQLPSVPFDPYEIGPWGNWTGSFIPGNVAALCRQKLHLPEKLDPHIFRPGDNIKFDSPIAFHSDAGTLWVATYSELLQLDENLHTNLSVPLPDLFALPTAVSADTTHVWIATAGAGLIEYDKTTGQSRRFTEKNGLLMDSISSLSLSGDTLWIGYARGETGGLGWLHLQTHQFNSLISPIHPTPETRFLAPRNTVSHIAAESADEVLISTVMDRSGAGQLLRYHATSGHWEDLTDGRIEDVAADPPYVALAQYPNIHPNPDPIGLKVQPTNGSWRSLGTTAGLPTGTGYSVAFQGSNLWVGGDCYIGIMDLRKLTMRKACYFHWPVKHIEIGQDCVWAGVRVNGDQGETFLCRIPLSVAND